MDRPSEEKPDTSQGRKLTFLDREARETVRHQFSKLSNMLTGKVTEDVLLSNIMGSLKKSQDNMNAKNFTLEAYEESESHFEFVRKWMEKNFEKIPTSDEEQLLILAKKL